MIEVAVLAWAVAAAFMYAALMAVIMYAKSTVRIRGKVVANPLGAWEVHAFLSIVSLGWPITAAWLALATWQGRRSAE